MAPLVYAEFVICNGRDSWLDQIQAAVPQFSISVAGSPLKLVPGYTITLIEKLAHLINAHCSQLTRVAMDIDHNHF